MRRDLQRLAIALSWIALSACGSEQPILEKYEKAAAECEMEAAPNQFIVNYTDGSMKVIRAPSEKHFLNNYMTKNLNRIAYAEPDYRVRVFLATQAAQALPTVQTADNWGQQRIDVSALWQHGVRGQGITVAVVDSGMAMDHPQLSNRIAVNPGEQGTDAQGRDRATNHVDDDGNGFIDDVAGFDFTNQGSKPLAKDYGYHGTHVAGVIAAQHEDTLAQPRSYVQGLAPAAQILPLAFLDETGSGFISDGVRAIKYAIGRGAKVINASWGGPICSRSLRDTITVMESQGVIFVAASGNELMDLDVHLSYPGSLNLPAQLTVGATGILDYMSDFSNYGRNAVHIFAPGSGIVSTVPSGGLVALSGTSMAAPFVSGAVALLLSAEPTAQIRHIRQALYESAAQRNDYVNASRGRLDLKLALEKLRQQLAN